MYEKFSDYMYYLLTTPFKRVKKIKNQWYILFEVLGKRFDHVRKSFLIAREQTMLATCDVSMLEIHAADRSIIRYPGEQHENFRRRIANYTEICRLGGTDPGILLAVRNLGFENVSINLAKRVRGDEFRWAEFYLIFPFDLEEAYPIGVDVLKKEVRKTKEVGALDNYMFCFSSKAEQPVGISAIMEIRSQFYPRSRLLLLDGNWLLDGKELLGDIGSDSIETYPTVLDIKSEVACPIHGDAALRLERDLWYLDGVELLDGSRSLASEIILYDI